MPRDPVRPLDYLVGGTVGTIAVLVVAATVIPQIFGYVVALITLALVARVVWFLTR